MESQIVNYVDFMKAINQGINASRLIYRGVGDAKYPLLPTVWRDAVQQGGHFQSFLEDIAICDENHKQEMIDAEYWDWSTRVCFENYLLAMFWYKSNLCGLPVEQADKPENYIPRWQMHPNVVKPYHYLGRREDVYKWFNEKHITLYQTFQYLWERINASPAPNRVIFYNSTIPRHHGLPTRLLDWSHSPYVALFFAAHDSLLLNEKEENENIPDNKSHTHFSVYALDIEKEEVISLVREDNISHNKFLFHQNGLFTIYNSADKFFLENNDQEKNKWPDLCKVEQQGFTLCKYDFLKKDAKEIIQEIKKYGVSYSRLKPSFSDVAHEINQMKEVPTDYCADYL